MITGLEKFDAADVERVIPGGVHVDNLHHEVRHRAFEQGHAVLLQEARLHFSARASREMIAQMLLVLREDTGAITARDGKYPVHLRAIVDRDENERRIERHRGKSARRHAVRAVFMPRGDYGNAGRETPQRLSKSRRVDLLILCD